MEAAALHRRAALVAAALVLGVFLTLAGQRAQSATAAEAPRSIGALRICTDCAATGGDLSRYGYVVLNAWDHDRIAPLRAKNPGIKILVYKNASASYSYACRSGVDDALLPAGTGYCASDRDQPDWFLKDTAGSRIQFCDFQGLWQMDVGSAGYQQAWLENVSQELAAKGWDGVVMDDVNSTAKYHLCGRTIAKYPTEAAYEEATRTFLQEVGPTLMQRGFLVLPNINFDCWEACWSRYLQYTSGAMREWWTKNTTGAEGHYTGDNWNWANGFLRLTQQQGKILLAVTYAPPDDVRSMRYARASFLLDWDGGPSAIVFEPLPGTTDPWRPDWTIDIGRPSGARYLVGGVWRRDFGEGTVLVNPGATAVSVALGDSYTLPDGTAVTSVTVQPTTGLVLRRAAADSTSSTTTTGPATTTVSSTTTSTTTSASTTTPTTTTGQTSTALTTATPTAPASTSTSTGTTTTTSAPVSPTIALGATVTAPGVVSLTWSGARGSKVRVLRAGKLLETTQNDGAARDMIGKRATGTVSYRVCELATSVCSPEVQVVLSAPRTLASNRGGSAAATSFRATHLHHRLDLE